MCSDNFKYQILQLTDLFYDKYPNPPYIEILKKKQRAYNCLLIHTREYFICLPYRSEVTHSYAYHFTSTIRSRTNKSGLDYTKIVIIQNHDYFSGNHAIVDNDEYRETVMNINRIIREASCFVNDYIGHIKGTNLLHSREFSRRYQYSPLKYFHDVLDI